MGLDLDVVAQFAPYRALQMARDLVRFARGLSSAMGGDGLNCTVPLRDFSVRWDAERAGQMFELVAADRTSDIGDLCTADGLPKTD